MTSQCFEVSKLDLHKTRFVEEPDPAMLKLAVNEVLLSVQRFSMSANNVTYAVAGGIGYWDYFPAEEGWGRVPVWGIGTVLRSHHAGVEEGATFHGFYPMSSQLVVEAGDVSNAGFSDIARHRQTPLSPSYNRYQRIERHEIWGEEFTPDFNSPQALEAHVLERIGTVSRVVISSASSKVALGLAFLLSKHEEVTTVGLTSSDNRAFVEEFNWFDQVDAYENIEVIAPDVPTIYIDICGNPDVRKRVHTLIGGNLKHSTFFGTTHWVAATSNVQTAEEVAELPGAAPALFTSPFGAGSGSNRSANENARLKQLKDEFTMSMRRHVTVHIGHDVSETYQLLLSGPKPDQAELVVL